MPAKPMTTPEIPCNCLAVRQAARHLTHFYDQLMAPAGLRSTQFSILAVLGEMEPMTINALSARLVMDRTTLGRNLLPLEREGLISVTKKASDLRNKEVCLTEYGTERLRVARRLWNQAQTHFEAAFGVERATQLRALARAVVAVPAPNREVVP